MKIKMSLSGGLLLSGMGDSGSGRGSASRRLGQGSVLTLFAAIFLVLIVVLDCIPSVHSAGQILNPAYAPAQRKRLIVNNISTASFFLLSFHPSSPLLSLYYCVVIHTFSSISYSGRKHSMRERMRNVARDAATWLSK